MLLNPYIIVMKTRLMLATLITFLVLGALLTSVFWVLMWYFQVTGPWLMAGIVFLVFFMVGIQWAIGPAIIKATVPMKKATDPFLLDTVRKLARQAELPMPEVFVVEDPTPNAFAFGRTQSSSSVAVHRGLLQRLNNEEVEAVLAHEIGHIKHRDSMVMTIASALPSLLYYAVFFGTLMMGSRDRKGGGVNYLGAWIGGMLAQFIGTLVVLYLSRVREYYADSFAGYTTHKPLALASALKKISGAPAPKTSTPSLRGFYISFPSAVEFLSTHPPVEKRVKALEKMARGE
jgi:heat shock protein HtpX